MAELAAAAAGLRGTRPRSPAGPRARPRRSAAATPAAPVAVRALVLPLSDPGCRSWDHDRAGGGPRPWRAIPIYRRVATPDGVPATWTAGAGGAKVGP